MYACEAIEIFDAVGPHQASPPRSGIVRTSYVRTFTTDTLSSSSDPRILLLKLFEACHRWLVSTLLPS